MKRKTFIYLNVVGAVAIVVPTLYFLNRNKPLNKTLGRPLFLSHICDAKTLREIGTVYKVQFPSEKRENQLVDLLLTNSKGKRFSQTSALSLINSLVDQKIKQDFETGKTVVIKGWVLSVTEARQCALFSLS